VIPRNQSSVVDSLATAASNFKIPLEPRRKYEVEVRHRPFVPDNIENWKVFENDEQIERFLCMTEEFADMKIDEDSANQKTDPPDKSHMRKGNFAAEKQLHSERFGALIEIV